jgi:protein phosphatase
MGVGEHETAKQIRRLGERYRRIDATLRERGRQFPELAGMGTTLTLACSLGSQMIIGHIGDSRAYLFRDGMLNQLTRDHTLVQSLVDAGAMTREQADKHPFRHMLTRSLGAGSEQLDGEFQVITLADKDQLLLCTDGLTDMVDNQTIANVLAGADSAQRACDQLIELALDNGGKDNVTLALAGYRFPTSKAES